MLFTWSKFLTWCASVTVISCVTSGEENIVFSGYGPDRPQLFIALNFARLSHPLARIFLCTHNYTDKSFYGEVPAPWKELDAYTQALAQLDIVRVIVQPDATPRHAKLMSCYRHMSDSPVVYERFCLLRFVTLAYVMDLYSLSSVLYVDSDIIMFRNMFELYGRDDDWGFGSWTSAWTAPRASEFADFLSNLYDCEPNHDAHSLVAHGHRVEPDEGNQFYLKLVKQTKDWWPFHAAGPRYYLTDMELYTAFLERMHRAFVPSWGPELGRSLCWNSTTRANGSAVNCKFMSNALDSPTSPGGCYSGNHTLSRYMTFFNFLPSGSILRAPFWKRTVVSSMHFNRMCKVRDCRVLTFVD